MESKWKYQHKKNLKLWYTPIVDKDYN